MKKIFVAAVAAGLLLSGCGNESPAERGDSVAEIVFTYDGAPLHCVGYLVSSDGKGRANSSLLSCDFVRYHAENPEKLNG